MECHPSGSVLPAACGVVAIGPMTLFENVYVHVQKRAGDKYHSNETDKNSGYFQCPVTKLFLIMQNYVFIIILIREVNKIYDFIEFWS